MERCEEQLVMSFKIKLLPIVNLDLRKAKKWYQEKSETLAQEFKIEVNKEIDYIGEYPEHYQLKYKEFRQSLVTRFPYAIFIWSKKSKSKLLFLEFCTQVEIPK